MATHVYTIHAPSDLSGAEAAERAILVKDGISWPAFFFAILWLLWHGMWLPLIGYLGFIALVAVVSVWLGQSAGNVVAVLGHVLFALEANNIRRWSLARRGWREIGESFGRSRGEAEIRFFHDRAVEAERGAAGPPQGAWGPATGRRSTPGRSAVPAVPHRHDTDEPGLGLFPEQER